VSNDKKIGGYDAIAAVANDRLPRLRADRQLGRFWAHRGEDGVKREKQLLIDFLCASAGAGHRPFAHFANIAGRRGRCFLP